MTKTDLVPPCGTQKAGAVARPTVSHINMICLFLIHPVNEYASRQHMIARLKVEAVFS